MYEKYLKQTETSRWELSSAIQWSAIKPDQNDKKAIQLLENAALIESFAPVFVMRGLSAWWDKVDESAIASIQFYDEYKHFYAIRKYLSLCGVQINDKKVIELRKKGYQSQKDTDKYRYLANYMISEHFTAHFYMRLLEIIHEENLYKLIVLIMQDEYRHCNIFYSLLEKHMISDREEVVQSIFYEATNFVHFGVEVVGDKMPQVEKNDFEVLLTLDKKIKSLTGMSIREYKMSEYEK